MAFTIASVPLLLLSILIFSIVLTVQLALRPPTPPVPPLDNCSAPCDAGTTKCAVADPTQQYLVLYDDIKTPTNGTCYAYKNTQVSCQLQPGTTLYCLAKTGINGCGLPTGNSNNIVPAQPNQGLLILSSGQLQLQEVGVKDGSVDPECAGGCPGSLGCYCIGFIQVKEVIPGCPPPLLN